MLITTRRVSPSHSSAECPRTFTDFPQRGSARQRGGHKRQQQQQAGLPTQPHPVTDQRGTHEASFSREEAKRERGVGRGNRCLLESPVSPQGRK